VRARSVAQLVDHLEGWRGGRRLPPHRGRRDWHCRMRSTVAPSISFENVYLDA